MKLIEDVIKRTNSVDGETERLMILYLAEREGGGGSLDMRASTALQQNTSDFETLKKTQPNPEWTSFWKSKVNQKELASARVKQPDRPQ